MKNMMNKSKTREKMRQEKTKRRIEMKGLKKRLLAAGLFATMVISPMSAAFAETDLSNAPQAPERPAVESYLDNDKIEEYNRQAADYNSAAESYNLAVDEEYNKAVEDTKIKNEEIAAHNAAEEQRVIDAEARNAQAIKDAEERNAQIDEENAAGLEQATKARDEQYEKDLAKYAEDQEKYEQDVKQYEYDAKMEKAILNAGYTSVEQYNERINKAYNEPAKKSVEKNASAKALTAKDTYSIEEAAEKSGRMIKVHIKHVFEGLEDMTLEETFEIDANDIITIKAISAPAENTNPGYASFYYNTDEAHSMGYWMESYSSVGTNARYNNYGWDCGDSHEISFKDGTVRKNDIEDIEVEYNYFWQALKVYKTYNTPVEPTAPEAPVKGEVDFTAAEHVAPMIEEIAQADIWNFVSDPVKRAYLELLSYMDLFEVPQIDEIVSSETLETAANINNAAAPAVQAAAQAENEAEAITDNETPLAASAEPATLEVLTDSPVAKADLEGNWALINLISAILTAIISAAMIVLGLKKKEENEDEENEADTINRKWSVRLLGLIPAIGAVIAFILTEDMTLKMQLTDNWTLMMIIILAIEAVLAIASKKTTEEGEEKQAETVKA